MKRKKMPSPTKYPPCPPPTTFEEDVNRRLHWLEKENQRLENEFKALKHKSDYFMGLSLACCLVTFLVVVAVAAHLF